jgi:hypothetical protein
LTVFQGSQFFYRTNGSQFFVHGVEYNDKGRYAIKTAAIIDPLEDSRSCIRNIPYLTNLGINTLLIESPRVSANHASCMRELQNANIYVLIRLDGKNSETIHDGASLKIPWDYNAYKEAEKLI